MAAFPSFPPGGAVGGRTPSTPLSTKTESMLSEFLDSYDAFAAHYSASPFSGHEDDTDCFFMFGSVGAGKSTTLARLLSPLPAGAFADLLASASQSAKVVEIEDVKIGRKAIQSTTVVPRVYGVQPRRADDPALYICDMPGVGQDGDLVGTIAAFLDTCVRRRVSRPRFLVVINTSAVTGLMDVRNMLAIYCRPLEDIFGDQYYDSIRSCYFVYTHPDGRSEAQIKKLLADAEDDLEEAPLGDIRFLKRMRKRGTTLNLANDDSESLLRKLHDMVKDDVASNEGRVAPYATLSERSRRLLTGETQLTQLSGLWVEDLWRQLSQDRAFMSALAAEVAAFQTRSSTELSDLVSKSAVARATFADVKIEHEQTKTRVESFQAESTTMKQDVATKGEKVAFSKRMMTIFDIDIGKSELINVQCHECRKGANRFGATKYIVKVRVVLNKYDGRPEDWAALMFDREDSDATLARLIDRGGSLIPDNIKVIERIRDASLVLNSLSGHNPRALSYSLEDGAVFAMDVETDQPCRFYLYTSRPFKYSLQYRTLYTQFATPLTDAEAELVNAEEVLKKRLEVHMSDKATLASMALHTSQAEDAVKANTQAVLATAASALKKLREHQDTMNLLNQTLAELNDKKNGDGGQGARRSA